MLSRLALMTSLTFGLATAGCNPAPDERKLLADSEGLLASSDWTLQDGPVAPISHEVRSEDYRRWLAAQRALDSVPGIDPPDPISLRYADDAEIDRMVRHLESDTRARAAIEGAGLTVRDFVITSVALEQAMIAGQAPVRTAVTPVPEANVALVRENSDEIRRQVTSSRIRVVRDDDRPRDRGKGQKGKGKGKGKGKKGRG
jgi:hypothetical protein